MAMLNGVRRIARLVVAMGLGALSACGSDTRSRLPARDSVAVRESIHVAMPPRASIAAKPAKSATPPLRRSPKPVTDTLARRTRHRPRLLRADPAAADLGSGNAVDVTLLGSGFTRRGNIVTFNGIVLGPTASDDGRRLQFTIPTQYPSHGEVPPRNISAGKYPVTVTNQNGVSDTLSYLLRSGPP